MIFILWCHDNELRENYLSTNTPQREERFVECEHYPIQWRKETETLLMWVIVSVIYNFDDLGSESCDTRFMCQFEAINTTIVLCAKYAFSNFEKKIAIQAPFTRNIFYPVSLFFILSSQ